MTPAYSTYTVHTDHSIDARSWIVSSTPGPSHHETAVLWSSKRTLDHAHDEVVERVSQRHSPNAYCDIHTPVKGWYLLITSPSKAFRAAQKQASPTSSSTSKSYINLVPSRTSDHAGGKSTEFKFHLVHSGSTTATSATRKRKSHVVVQTELDGANAYPTPAGWTAFDNQQQGPSSGSTPFAANASNNTSQSSLRTSTFILRPINHSIAKAHVSALSDSSSFSRVPHDHTAKSDKRMSLRGLAGLFSATDNSFELVWQDGNQQQQEGGASARHSDIPILIFEDHPSMLRTETRGQFHLLQSTIVDEFAMPSLSPPNHTDTAAMGKTDLQQATAGDGQVYDPMTFFVSVGLAYLGFLEDQEAYKAASQG